MNRFDIALKKPVEPVMKISEQIHYATRLQTEEKKQDDGLPWFKNGAPLMADELNKMVTSLRGLNERTQALYQIMVEANDALRGRIRALEATAPTPADAVSTDGMLVNLDTDDIILP